MMGPSATMRLKLKRVHVLIAAGLLSWLPASGFAMAPAKGPHSVLKLTKRAAKRVVPAGGVARFTLTVRDGAIVVAARVKVCDRMPPGTRWGSASRRARVEGRDACFRLGTLGPGQTVKIKIGLRVDGAARGKLRNTARASARDARAVRAAATVRISG